MRVCILWCTSDDSAVIYVLALVVQAGKMDLTEVEGLADLLAAETAAQHRQVISKSLHPSLIV